MVYFVDKVQKLWRRHLVEQNRGNVSPLRENEVYISALHYDWRVVWENLTSLGEIEKNNYMVIGDLYHGYLEKVFNEQDDFMVEVPIVFEEDGVIFRGRVDVFDLQEYVPVEIKTCGALPDAPLIKHRCQLLAYMRGFGVKYGYLMYVSRNNMSFRIFYIPYSQVLWRMVLNATKLAIRMLKEGKHE